MHTDMFSSE